jgi:hypothetical protein
LPYWFTAYPRTRGRTSAAAKGRIFFWKRNFFWGNSANDRVLSLNADPVTLGMVDGLSSCCALWNAHAVSADIARRSALRMGADGVRRRKHLKLTRCAGRRPVESQAVQARQFSHVANTGGCEAPFINPVQLKGRLLLARRCRREMDGSAASFGGFFSSVRSMREPGHFRDTVQRLDG